MKDTYLDTRLWLAAIIDSSDDAIISKNLEGVIQSWNPGAQRIFGYSPEEVIGKSILMLIPPDRQDEEAKIIARLKKGERIEHFETIRETKDGRHLNISLTVSPVKNEKGEIVGASKIARDITDRKRIEEDLRLAQLMLEDHARELENRVEERTASLEKNVAELESFTYSLSHDLRAPLRAIQSYHQIIVADYEAALAPAAIELFHKAGQAAEKMDVMIHDLLAFTRLSHEAPPALVTLDTNRIIVQIIEGRLDLQAPRASINIQPDLPLVRGHEVLLAQCLSNLLDNAVKFVAPGVVPVVHVRWASDLGRLIVQDNGTGIKSAEQARLFQIFQRVHGNDYPGTGLGLAIVRKAAEKMGGAVGVDSQPGHGSAFWLQLPFANDE